jgi:hypothetical protein
MQAPAEPPGAADYASIAARPAEYEAATQRWIQQTVQHIMRARDPIYAQLRTEQAETVPATRLDLGDGQELAVDPFRIHVDGSIAIDPLIGFRTPQAARRRRWRSASLLRVPFGCAAMPGGRPSSTCPPRSSAYSSATQNSTSVTTTSTTSARIGRWSAAAGSGAESKCG